MNAPVHWAKAGLGSSRRAVSFLGLAADLFTLVLGVANISKACVIGHMMHLTYLTPSGFLFMYQNKYMKYTNEELYMILAQDACLNLFIRQGYMLLFMICLKSSNVCKSSVNSHVHCLVTKAVKIVLYNENEAAPLLSSSSWIVIRSVSSCSRSDTMTTDAGSSHMKGR